MPTPISWKDCTFYNWDTSKQTHVPRTYGVSHIKLDSVNESKLKFGAEAQLGGGGRARALP